jgi:hypothetical protein
MPLSQKLKIFYGIATSDDINYTEYFRGRSEDFIASEFEGIVEVTEEA